MISCSSAEKKQNEKPETEFEKMLSQYPDIKLPYFADLSEDGVPMSNEFEIEVLNPNSFYFSEYSEAHSVIGKFKIGDEFYGVIIFWIDFEETSEHLLVLDKDGTLVSDLLIAYEFRHASVIGNISEDLTIKTETHTRAVYHEPDAINSTYITYSIIDGVITETEKIENLYDDNEIDISENYKIIIAYAQDWSDTSEDWDWYAYVIEEELKDYGVFVIGSEGKKAVLDDVKLYWEMDLTEILEKNNVEYYCYIFVEYGKEPLLVEYAMHSETIDRAKKYFGLN